MRPLLPDNAVQVLRDLHEIWADTPYTLIGATALGLQVDMRWRRTDDLDLTVSASLADFSKGPDHRAGWRRDRKYEHRWYAHGLKVDVLPAGPDLLARGEVVWPSTGYAMNITGFRHVFDRARRMLVADDVEVDVAPVPIIVLLKTISYLDRPLERERDLQDLVHILDTYVDPTSDAGAAVLDEAVAAGLSFEGIHSFAIGRELAPLLNEQERALLDEFIAKARNENDPHATGDVMAREAPPSWGGGYEPIATRLEALEYGLSRRDG